MTSLEQQRLFKRRMQTNKKGESEPQGSSNDLDSHPSPIPTESADEEIKLITSAELEDREKELAHARGKEGMENTTESSTTPPQGAASSAPRTVELVAPKKGNLIQFLKEVIIEFRKISWPGSKEVIQATWSVLALVAIITLLVLGFDWLLSHAFFGPLEHFARMHGGGVGSGH